jgi:hypothetical protein
MQGSVPQCRLTNLQANQTSTVGFAAIPPVVPPVTPTSARLINLSSRGWVGTGMPCSSTASFSAASPTPQVIVRALGPTLTDAGLAAPLANPRLRVTTVTGEPIAENDDWGQAANAADLQRPRLRPGPSPGSRPAAHPASARTLHGLVDGVDAATGLALVEILDPQRTIADQSPADQPVQRGWVGRDDDLLIGGLILDGGDAPRRVLVRVLGPTLAEAQLGDRAGESAPDADHPGRASAGGE